VICKAAEALSVGTERTLLSIKTLSQSLYGKANCAEAFRVGKSGVSRLAKLVSEECSLFGVQGPCRRLLWWWHVEFSVRRREKLWFPVSNE